MTGQRPAWQDWAPEAVAGGVVVLLGLLEIAGRWPGEGGRAAAVVLVCGIAAATVSSRRTPGVALALLWVLFVLQLAWAVPILTVEVAVIVVAFATARWGSAAVALAGAVSVPLAVGIALAGSNYDQFRSFPGFPDLLNLAYRLGGTALVGGVVVGMLAMFAPFFAGLAFRYRDRARDSRRGQEVAEADAAVAVRASEQAHEIARLREGQTRLARDVHDVVGHSLAVILAQAESAQYLADGDPVALKRTMATIATSARASLQDVRAVLAAGTDPTPAPAPTAASLDSLVEGLRASGHDVRSSEVGASQPLPPELATVAYRVLQEMLTNALKHGSRDRPVVIERHWPDGFGHDLRIEVHNTAAVPEQSDDWGGEETRPLRHDHAGQGLTGMARRLDSVGGRIDVRRRDEPDGQTFTVTAWVPVRTVDR